MKRLWAVLFFCACALLSAQDRSSINLYIAPVTGGSREAREFFDDNIHAEIFAANYSIVYTPEEADYILEMTLTEVEDPETSDVSNRITVVVMDNVTETTIVEFSWDYHELEEMYQWNLYLVYNALANVTAKAKPQDPDSLAHNWWGRWFFLGLRVGPSFSGYYFQEAPNYRGGYSGEFSGEGGLVAELRLFRFLSFQLEALLTFDVFNAVKTTPRDSVQDVSSDVFTTMSLMFPVILKIPFGFEKFALSFYAGSYFLLSPQEWWGFASGEKIEGFSTSFPLGFIVGADMGVPLGPGELFVDLRYSRDLGTAVIQNGPRYTRDRINVALGYKFGLIKRRRGGADKNGADKNGADKNGADKNGTDKNEI
jgi:hypothetical protein